ARCADASGQDAEATRMIRRIQKPLTAWRLAPAPSATTLAFISEARCCPTQQPCHRTVRGRGGAGDDGDPVDRSEGMIVHTRPFLWLSVRLSVARRRRRNVEGLLGKTGAGDPT